MITLTDVHKSFGPNAVLRGVDLTIERGTSMVVIGGSGTGKSVLLKSILGLVKPDRGLIALDKDLRVVISSRLKSSSPPPGQVSALLAYEGKRIRPPSRFQPDLEALAEHRATVFVA